MESCEVCGGPLELLGQLGARSHYRCQNCGMECSSTAPPEESDDTENEDA